MKLKYEFANGEVTEIEVADEVGTVIMDSRREEANRNRKERYHCWSMGSITYEGIEYSTPDFTEALFDGTEERDARVREAFSHLTATQQRRMLMLATGLSEREIAKREGVNIRAVVESVEYARKKFLKFF